jgi:hypothetical protein
MADATKRCWQSCLVSPRQIARAGHAKHSRRNARTRCTNLLQCLNHTVCRGVDRASGFAERSCPCQAGEARLRRQTNPKSTLDSIRAWETSDEKQREVTQRNGDRQAVWCRLSGRSVSGRRSTAAETHETEAEIFYNAPNNVFLFFSSFEASSTEAL